MRRDICYFYPVSVDKLFDAYHIAATNDKFRRECNSEPYHTMSFGLNFSMKYNFNGGACTIRFMPYQNGSAVNLRFSIAQLAGARYEAYANDLAHDVSKVLGVLPSLIQIDVEAFMLPQNQITTAQSVATQPSPAPVVTDNLNLKRCANCNAVTGDDAKFCPSCGTPVISEPTPLFCAQCGAKAKEGAAFCINCGSKL